jgi:hypothetical protein
MPFAPSIFGTELAHLLNTLAAVQSEESKRFTRHEHMPLMAVFTNPVGTSWFEADMLTRHFYANQASLESLLASDCVPGARETFEWRPGDGPGLTMLQARQMLLARFVEVASSLQCGVSPLLATLQPPPPPVTRWPPPPPPPPASRWPGPVRKYNPPLRRAGTTPAASQASEPAEEWGPFPYRASSWEATPAASQEWPPRPPSPEAVPSQAPEDAMETGSQRQSPRAPSPGDGPVAPPRREPRWLLPRDDSVPPATPGSEASTEPRAQLEPPNLTDAGWFSGGAQEE